MSPPLGNCSIYVRAAAHASEKHLLSTMEADALLAQEYAHDRLTRYRIASPSSMFVLLGFKCSLSIHFY